MKTLILGGVRSGKSRLAETLAKDLAKETNKSVVYFATASTDDDVCDDEMAMRIEIHKHHRPKDWMIVEEPIQLAEALKKYSNEKTCIIIDCLTLWITNLIMLDDDKMLDLTRSAFIDFLQNTKNELFIVSNETGLGIMPLGKLTRKFGDEAGITNQLVAAQCDRVVLTVAGLPLVLKGPPLNEKKHDH